MVLLIALRTRVLPALLTAFGVVLITAGLLSYADPATAGATALEPPEEVTLEPSAPPTPGVTPGDSASASPSVSPRPTAKPTGRAVATRVRVPALKIDLAVVKQPSGYPYCDVAMYISALAQPGEGRATYIFAHARDGMFGPIYHLAMETHQPRKLLGLIVEVYTSDDRVYTYEITGVRLHQLNLDKALDAKTEQLWLQTSEGPKGTPGKTQLVGDLLFVGDARHAEAHPKAKPLSCG